MQRKICDVMPSGAVTTLPPSASVQDAAAVMKDRRQCAVLVLTGGRLDGILTEQDVVRRVVAEHRDPDTVTLAEVMTPHPDTIDLGDPALKGLQMMEDGGYRHLPVLRDGLVVGLVSRADYLGEEKTELESERHYWESIG